MCAPTGFLPNVNNTPPASEKQNKDYSITSSNEFSALRISSANNVARQNPAINLPPIQFIWTEAAHQNEAEEQTSQDTIDQTNENPVVDHLLDSLIGSSHANRDDNALMESLFKQAPQILADVSEASNVFIPRSDFDSILAEDIKDPHKRRQILTDFEGYCIELHWEYKNFDLEFINKIPFYKDRIFNALKEALTNSNDAEGDNLCTIYEKLMELSFDKSKGIEPVRKSLLELAELLKLTDNEVQFLKKTMTPEAAALNQESSTAELNLAGNKIPEITTMPDLGNEELHNFNFDKLAAEILSKKNLDSTDLTRIDTINFNNLVKIFKDAFHKTTSDREKKNIISAFNKELGIRSNLYKENKNLQLEKTNYLNAAKSIYEQLNQRGLISIVKHKYIGTFDLTKFSKLFYKNQIIRDEFKYRFIDFVKKDAITPSEALLQLRSWLKSPFSWKA